MLFGDIKPPPHERNGIRLSLEQLTKKLKILVSKFFAKLFYKKA